LSSTFIHDLFFWGVGVRGWGLEPPSTPRSERIGGGMLH